MARMIAFGVPLPLLNHQLQGMVHHNVEAHAPQSAASNLNAQLARMQTDLDGLKRRLAACGPYVKLTAPPRDRFALLAGRHSMRARDGSFRWLGKVGGEPVEFVVDTGATLSGIPSALASRLGLPLLRRTAVQTANGLVDKDIFLADFDLVGGVSVSAASLMGFHDMPYALLGMDVLSKIPFAHVNGCLQVPWQ